MREMGTLFLVPTPIGNLKDITLRALEVLREVALIAAEDTRTARKLLSHYDIRKPLVSFHQHNWRQRVPQLLARLQAGESVAVISEAGMPGISDPGAELVKAAVEAGLPVVVLPGPSAILPALVVSGLATERFVFEGFLPRRGRARRERLEALAREERTIVLFEAPHRLRETLRDLGEALGDRRAAAVRELSKHFEEVVRGRLSQLEEHFATHPPRGEFTLVVEGREALARGKELPPLERLAQEVEETTRLGLSRAQALRHVARRHGLSRRELYRLLLEGRDGP